MQYMEHVLRFLRYKLSIAERDPAVTQATVNIMRGQYHDAIVIAHGDRR